MKILLFYLSIILCFSCKENSKETYSTIQKNQSSEIISPTKTKVVYENEVIPGKKIGTMVLEGNVKKVLDSLGKPDLENAAMGKAILTWKNDGDLLMIFTEMGMDTVDFSSITAIRSLSKNYKTEDNLGVGTPIEALKKYYRLDPAGKFTYNGKHYYLYTTPKGIAFEIGMNQKCNGVLVYPEATDPETFFTSMYQNFKKL